MTGGGQKFIARNRAPRVQIEYDVELYGAEKKVQLPFVMGVMADLSGRPESPLPPVADRSFLEIDVDTFDARMKAMRPRAAFTVPNTLTGDGNIAVDLTFERMDDFTPGAIAARVEPLRQLFDARRQLADLATYMDGKSGAEALLEALLRDPARLAAIASGAVADDPPSPAQTLMALRIAAPVPADSSAPDPAATALAALRAAAPAEAPPAEAEADRALAALRSAAPVPAEPSVPDPAAAALAALRAATPAEAPPAEAEADRALAALRSAAPVAAEPSAPDPAATALAALRSATPAEAPPAATEADRALSALRSAAPAEAPPTATEADHALSALRSAAPVAAEPSAPDPAAVALAALRAAAPVETPPVEAEADRALAALRSAAPVPAEPSAPDPAATALAALRAAAPAEAPPAEAEADRALSALRSAAPVAAEPSAPDPAAAALAALRAAAPAEAPPAEAEADRALAALRSAAPVAADPSAPDPAATALAALRAATPPEAPPVEAEADRALSALRSAAPAPAEPSTPDPATAALAALRAAAPAEAPPVEAEADRALSALRSAAPVAAEPSAPDPAAAALAALRAAAPAEAPPAEAEADRALAALRSAAPVAAEPSAPDPAATALAALRAATPPEAPPVETEADPLSALDAILGDVGAIAVPTRDEAPGSQGKIEPDVVATPTDKDPPVDIDALLSGAAPGDFGAIDPGAAPNGRDAADLDGLLASASAESGGGLDALSDLDALLGGGHAPDAGRLPDGQGGNPPGEAETRDPLDDLDFLLDGAATSAQPGSAGSNPERLDGLTGSDPVTDPLADLEALLAGPAAAAPAPAAAADPLADLQSWTVPDEPVSDPSPSEPAAADGLAALDALLSEGAGGDPLADLQALLGPDPAPAAGQVSVDPLSDLDALMAGLAADAPDDAAMGLDAVIAAADDPLAGIDAMLAAGTAAVATRREGPMSDLDALLGGAGSAYGTLNAPAPNPEALNRKVFRMAVFGDFSGRSAGGRIEVGATLAARRATRLDVDTIEEVIERFATRLMLPIGPEGRAIAVDLKELDDLHPDELAEKVALFDELKVLRQRLSNASTAAKAVAEMQGWGATFTAPAAPTRARSGAAAVPADRRLSDFQMLIGDTTPRAATASPAADLIARIVGPYVLPGTTPEARALRASVDDAMGSAMRLILHHPEFQAIEAAWRSLDLLARQIETDEKLELFVFDVSAEEFAADIGSAHDLSQSGVFQILNEPLTVEGGIGYSAVIGLYTFEETPPHAELLGRMGRIAAHVQAPFVAAMAPGFVDVAKRDRHPLTARAWDALRGDAGAAWIGLAAPRFLLRRPYGERSDPIDAFEFEEFTLAEGLSGMLWCNPAVLVGILLAKAWTDGGPKMTLGKTMSIGQMPYYIVTDQHGDQVALPCTERNVTTEKAEIIVQRGFMPVVSVRGRDVVRLGAFQSLAGQELAGPWSGNPPPAPPPSGRAPDLSARHAPPAAAAQSVEDELDALLAGFGDSPAPADPAAIDADLAALLEGL
ncbi:MAG: type VI secretion system contractile sheath small subunit [Paracoccaceae bacterium]|nr:MAG: type VI secretion system contractile sheath small subunit [Paracoccaceae bacterium]